MAELIVYYQDKRLFSFPLEKNRVSLGRASQNDLVLNDHQVSRDHAVLVKEPSGIFLVNMSQQGSKLNNTLVQKSQKLEHEDELILGQWKLIFLAHSESSKQENEQRQTQITQLSEQPGQETQILSIKSESQDFKALKPILLIENPDEGNRRYLMRKKQIIIGSDERCDVVLNDPFISKQHAEFTIHDGQLRVRDLDSKNGTTLDQATIKTAFLKEGQTLRLGKTAIQIFFREEESIKIPTIADNVFCGMVGQSSKMKNLFGQIIKIAATDMTVLIRGETGTGKEMVARALHDLSPRKSQPYVVINCAAISPQLIESELFGHEKGAFTGAEQRHIGVFEQASTGTLFLDEVGELPLPLQAKILRVLEYQTLRRVGGSQEITINTRVVAATHRDLENMVAQNLFREDLLYRLQILPLFLPPLRERREDIKPLALSFIQRLAAQPFSVHPDVLTKLENHDWPGNIRELKNALLRAMVFAENQTILPQHISLTTPIKTSPPRVNVSGFFDQTHPHSENPDLHHLQKDGFEKSRIIRALTETQGDKDLAAKMLQMGRSTLFRKIKELNIETKIQK